MSEDTSTKQQPTMTPSPDKLSLLAPEQLARWRGLPLFWLRTPESAWSHNFTPVAVGLSLMDSGTMTTHLGVQGRSTELDLGAGSLALFNPGMEVKVRQIGAHQARRILLELNMGSAFCRSLFNDDLAATGLRPTMHFEDRALAPVLREMVREISAGCPNGALFAESLSIGVAVHLGRTRGIRPVQAERGKLSAGQAARLIELIQSEMASDLSLSIMSAVVGLSKPHFVRLFRNTMGMSPHRYVVLQRIERARQLVSSFDVPLVDIALDVGFASQSHMTRIFRDVIGVTPGDLRKQLSGKKSQ